MKTVFLVVSLVFDPNKTGKKITAMIPKNGLLYS